MSHADSNSPAARDRLPVCLAILGPTCSGKSSVAFELANKLDAEIISCDSMQVYRGMDIGTATPAADMLEAIPHHLVNELDISERFDAYRFVRAARRVLQEIAARNPGKPVILAGGTGLYAKALIYDYEMQPSDPGVYSEIVNEYADGAGEQALRDELAGAASGIPPEKLCNPRRLLRAVEILRLGGDPTAKPAHNSPVKPLPNFKQYVLLPAKDDLDQAIHRRTRRMLNEGWIPETERLLDAGLLRTPTARQALGYPEVASYIRGLIPDLDSLHDEIVRRTRQYARKQRTWFRRQHPGAFILPFQSGVSREDVATGILSDSTAFLAL